MRRRQKFIQSADLRGKEPRIPAACDVEGALYAGPLDLDDPFEPASLPRERRGTKSRFKRGRAPPPASAGEQVSKWVGDSWSVCEPEHTLVNGENAAE